MGSGLVVNLLGGPGTGKSTTMAGVFFLLKTAGVDCEMVTEFAKDLVWEGRTDLLSCQPYIFGKQRERIDRVADKVDVTITDSPLLLSIYYGEDRFPDLPARVLEAHHSRPTLNVFLDRVKVYNPNGRVQTEEEAKAVDADLLRLLEDFDLPYVRLAACPEAPARIVDLIQARLLGVAA